MSFIAFMISYVVLRSRYTAPSLSLLAKWSDSQYNQASAAKSLPPEPATASQSLVECLQAGETAHSRGFLSDSAYLSALRAVYRKWRQSNQPVSGDGVFTVPGGIPAGICMVLLPATLFGVNAGFAVADSGCVEFEGELVCVGPFPYAAFPAL